jgi:TfoX/Sxy family transcriptional regulator of competence genes
MAYDEDLAARAEALLESRSGLSERRMFGGVGFMLEGNMAVGVIGEDLIVRLDPEDAAQALAEEGVRKFDFSGRPMRGWIFVAPEATASERDLARWVEAGADYASSLPAKS